MSKDTGEERNLPPTQQKLRKMRKEGQVATSKEFVSVSVFALAFVYLYGFSSGLYREFYTYMADSFSRPLTPQALDGAAEMFEAAGFLGRVLAPLGAIVLVAAVISSGLIMRGFPFSLKPLSLKMDRMNPVNGFKQIFSLKNIVELGQSLLKFLIAFIIVYLYVKSYMASVLWSPLCGSGCAMGLFGKMLAVAIGLILLSMLVIVLLDIKLSKWLFTRDAKMSISELKRELNEEHGDPQLKHAMKQEGQRMVRAERRYSFEDANFQIFGDGFAIGIHFLRGVSPAPIIASIGIGAEAHAHQARGAEKELLHYIDPDLARDIATKGKAGRMIPFDLFDRTARAMVRSGFLS